MNMIQKVNTVLDLLVELQRAGADVVEIRIGARNPVIELSRPITLSGCSAVRTTRTDERGHRQTVHTMPVRGCQVEWSEVA